MQNNYNKKIWCNLQILYFQHLNQRLH